MHKVCVLFVEGMSEICVKLFGFYPAVTKNVSHVEKPGVFATGFARLIHVFFHAKKVIFKPVIDMFLPIINRTNNNDNYIKLTFNYWRT